MTQIMIEGNEGVLRGSSHPDWEGQGRLLGGKEFKVRPDGWVGDSQSKKEEGEMGSAKGGKSAMLMALKRRKYYPGMLFDPPWKIVKII